MMELNRNMGTVDRIIRISLALVFVALIATGTVTGVLAIILGILTAVFAVTSVFSFCPRYLGLKLSTRPE
jgi:predicted PurR-regulated permease PerM